MFTNNFKLDGIENILDDIGYLSEEAKDENDAGEKYEGKYKKTGKKSRDYDEDGTVEDEADEYAGVKDRAIKKAKKKEEEDVNEKIDVGADAGATISDFVRSSDPRFAGDTKKQRIKRALGAYYGAQKEEVELEEEITSEKGKAKAAEMIAKRTTDSGRAKSGQGASVAAIKHIQRSNRDGLGGTPANRKVAGSNWPKSYSGIGGTGNKAARRAAALKSEEYMDEAGTMQGGGKDPCWKGYEMVGMKKKGGREVPNCVPKEEYEELVMDMIEEGYDMDQVREVIAAFEDGFEVIFEEDGVTINDTQEVLDEEAQFLSDVEMVADCLYTEGVIENEDQFFELMEDLSEEEIQDIYDLVLEATAMAKHGYDETKLRSRAGGGEAADRATALEKKPTYGDANKAKQRQNYARAQRGDFRKTASSNPGLHGYAHKSNDPKVTAKQAARGAQRGALTPNEKKNLNMGYEMIGNSLEEGGLEVRNFSWDEVMKEAWKKKAMKKEGYQRTPEKSDKEDKRYEPVRGERTPMPPRGNKRREDFEKWYAANVR